ncbi:NAD(P)H-dependent oxidoreductase subunit E [Sphaerotilus sp.]|uniref:NAD(P)H-dependent oxidoreductase subunit E n=1 Tax=Sphaerotilus sp. TaxID=2093942 RepID=UPI00286D7A07|nr:NAD(P)H-dependent oxidoreductase subunit E [Sphaerotilus sp.]
MIETPLDMALTGAQRQALDAVLAERAALPGALLPVLHGVQDALGFIPPAALPVIGRALSLSRAEVHGVVTYYHHFRTTPPRGRVVQVCRAEACRSMGAEALMAHARATIDAHGCDTLEAAYCLGLCAQSPAVMVGDRLHARVTPAKLDALLVPAHAHAQGESA